MYQLMIFEIEAKTASSREVRPPVSSPDLKATIVNRIESDGSPKRNGMRILCESLGVDNGSLVAVSHDHPIDHIEPLEEKGPSRTRLIQQACLQWHCGYRDGSLVDIANEFGVSRAIVSRYARQIAEHCGIPAARSDATAERCRVAQLKRREGK